MKGGRSKTETKRTDSKLSVKRGAPSEKAGKKPAAKKEKAAKDPNKPKRPASAFFVFMEEFRKTYKEKHPNNKSVAAVGKAGEDKWKSLSEAVYALSWLVIVVVMIILKIGQACRPVVKGLGMWGSVKALGRGYECIMGVVIFVPIAVLAWFPFVTEFQTRLLFNQAFSRGLQIQRILASGKKKK